MANELQLQTGPYRTTFIGTEIIRPSSKSEWRNYGEILRRVDEAKQWAIGDWLADGKSHYGDGLYKIASEIVDYDAHSLRDLKSIAERFPLSLRNDNIAWAHHKTVSSIKKLEERNGKLQHSDEFDIDKAQELLTLDLSVRELRNAVSEYKRRQDEEIRLFNEPEKYDVVLADPAWEYDFSRSDSRQIDNQYLPSSMEDMKRLRIPAADNAVLFMWATSPKIREALELIDAWGFEYKTCMVWVKNKIGMGYYARQKHELLFIAGKGSLQLPDTDKRPESIFFADRTEHSEKPEIVYELVEQMYPGYKKLEMFARKKRDGWDAWGDEV